MNNIRLKKSLVETKFVAKAEDIPAIKSKMDKDDVVRIVDEADGEPVKKRSLNNPKIEKYVNNLNQLIASAIDSDGDPIPVVDKSGTWEEPCVYSPIIYKNGALKVVYHTLHDNKPEVDVILKRNMEYDGIPTLQNIKKLYNAAIKRNTKPQAQMGESDITGKGLDEKDWRELYDSMSQNESVNEDDGMENTGVVNTDKLRTDVAKFMDKLDLAQFKNVIQKIDKPQEQAEVIAAFAERIGIPRMKLPSIISTLKDITKQ